MKTFKKEATLKSALKKVAYLGILATLVASCGSDNSTNSTDSQAFNDTYSNSQLESRAGVQCAQGGRRLPDEIYHTTETGLNQLYGPFQQGSLPAGGSIGTTFVGVTRQGDIITVAKVTDGNTRVHGYNIRVSFCEMRTQEGYPMLATDRAHRTYLGTSFKYRTHPLILDVDGFCGLGSVDAGGAIIDMDTWSGRSQNGNNITLNRVQDERIFFKPNCNGMY